MISHLEKEEILSSLHIRLENQVQMIKDFNVKNKTLDFLVENMSKYHLDLGVGIISLNKHQ